ncbi:hypothetical protein M9H77_07017 [Catharanthus roseus]|uniref:Uncharacterized protein n=1 Tax=Catharanthus roseus TaxID=4058 RepID=A0ACC0BU02_CATRO|nr:hypothetical protein M9H77_07017 [Catharanthus roseus]
MEKEEEEKVEIQQQRGHGSHTREEQQQAMVGTPSIGMASSGWSKRLFSKVLVDPCHPPIYDEEGGGEGEQGSL